MEKQTIQIMTEDDVASMLGIKVTALRNRHCKGSGHPPFIRGTRPKRYLRDAVEKWLRSIQEYEIRSA